MSDTTQTPPAAETPTAKSRCTRREGRRHRRGRWLFLLGLAALGAFALPRAFAWGGHGCARGGAPTAEALREHYAQASDHVLDRVDATDEQYTQVEGILDGAAPAHAALAAEAQDLKVRFHQALVADPTQRDRLETLRVEALGLADRASSRALDDLVQLASVLTPEQRQELTERWAEHHPDGATTPGG